MGALIITVVAGLLCTFNVISLNIFFYIASASVVWAIVGTTLYLKLGWFKFFYHDLLAWHTPDDSPQYSDGCSQHATCKHCGNDIMQDSQGNWFC